MINNNQQQRVTGFNCPMCSILIPVSSLDLLGKPSISCPTCGLELIIDKYESKRALELLENVEQSKEALKEASTSSL